MGQGFFSRNVTPSPERHADRVGFADKHASQSYDTMPFYRLQQSLYHRARGRAKAVACCSISTTRRKHQEACLNPTRPARKSTVRHYTRTGCAIKKSRLGVILGVLDAPDREPRYRSNRTVVHRPPASRKPTAQRAQPGSNTRHHPATDRATNPARAKDARAIPHAARGGAPPSTDQDVPL
ncbi:MAG: hypothetical protein ACI9OU_002318 [Candidatus Promineifilaceae bacterium]|jgi:hypothetical protein